MGLKTTLLASLMAGALSFNAWAAEPKHAVAMHGDIKYGPDFTHFEGLNGTKNINIARGWFDQAAKLGDSFAMLRLGEIYISGLTGPANPKIGIKYVRQAAKSGLVQAQHILGLAYLRGIGVDVDHAVGREWLEKAAAAGFEPSIAALNELDGAQ